jgi:hypothetical protein
MGLHDDIVFSPTGLSGVGGMPAWELPYGDYTWWVQAQSDCAGEGPWSDAGMFRLLPFVPGPVMGPEARVQFEGYAIAYGDSIIEFENLSVGTALDDELQSAYGVTFASTRSTVGVPFTEPHNVVVASFGGSHTVIGTPGPGGGPDGRVGYEIRFDVPQQRVALQRLWSEDTATRFYDAAGMLLHELTGVANPFVGYLGDPYDTATWIKTIEVDTRVVSGMRQVGYSDDLFFGSVIP